MSKCRLLLSVVLVLCLMPLDVYASAFAGPDPNFPCGSHQCACSNRKKCMSHCCCFPKKAKKPTAPDQASIKSCGGGDDVTVPPERREVIPTSGLVVHSETVQPTVSWAPIFYSSFVPDIFIPPPESSC